MVSCLLALSILMFSAEQTPPVSSSFFVPAVQVTGEGRIDGLVKRFRDQEPMSGVNVTLSGPFGQQATVSESDGRFVFRNLPAGRYVVAVHEEGYFVRRPGSGTVDPGLAVVGAGRSTATVVLSMIQGGTISGRILDPMGRPSTGASVTAARQLYRDGRPMLGSVKTTTSDDRGEYRLFWLEPGEYVVSAEKHLPNGVARGYFPGSDDGRTAIPVPVSEGADSLRRDFSLGNAPSSVTVSGIANFENPDIVPRVGAVPVSPVVPKDEPGLDASRPDGPPRFFLIPLDDARVYENIAQIPNAANSRDQSAGKFELRNVRSGSYELFAVMRDRASRYYMAHQTIDVGSQDLGGIVLSVKPGVDLNGTVTAGIGKPAPSVRIHLRPRLPLPEWPGVTITSTDGAFTIPNVPQAQYAVSIEPFDPNSYVAEFLHGRDSVLDRGILTVARGQAQNLEALIQPAAATIRGRVTALPAQLAGGVIITLVPEEARRDNNALYKRAVSTDGSFSFGGVTPGKYTVFVWDTLPEGAEFNAEFMRVHGENGMDVTVSPGSTSAIELRLISK